MRRPLFPIRWLRPLVLLCLPLVVAAFPGSRLAAQVACTYTSGFQALHDLIPEQVGDCVENEQVNPTTGNVEQHTTLGLLIWQQTANLTGFIGSTTTWFAGPDGLVSRANDAPAFSWEPTGPIVTLEPTLPTAVPTKTTPMATSKEFQPPGGPSCRSIAVWPSDLLPYVSPDPGISSDLSAFLGVWEGVWGGSLLARMRVRDISTESAGLAYAWDATSSFAGGVTRTRASVLAGKTVTWGTALKFSFTMGGDHSTLDGVRDASGSISKITLRRCSV